MSVLLFSLLAGCISTQPHAPFSFGWATEAYFLEAGSNSPDRGTAILILLDGAELDCDRLKEAATLEPGQTSTGALEAAAIQTVGGTDGEGLLFSMSYVAVDTDDDPAHNTFPKPGFQGFWAKNATAIKEDWTRIRSLSAIAMYDHYVYQSGGLPTGPGRNPLWLKVDEITGTEIKGTFSADLWAGPFHGKDCGSWVAAEDSGRDSWR